MVVICAKDQEEKWKTSKLYRFVARIYQRRWREYLDVSVIKSFLSLFFSLFPFYFFIYFTFYFFIFLYISFFLSFTAHSFSFFSFLPISFFPDIMAEIIASFHKLLIKFRVTLWHLYFSSSINYPYL